MQRFFIEIAYDGNNYCGSQKQINAPSVEAEIYKAFSILYKNVDIALTGASRTDAGVNAESNFFHIDMPIEKIIHHKDIYKLNNILPLDIAIKNIFSVPQNAHCRFDAIDRTYQYFITTIKNPLLFKHRYYYPYAIDEDLLNASAALFLKHNDYKAFCKKHNNNHTSLCTIYESKWIKTDAHSYVFYTRANRFLRGMVRAMVATSLQIARRNMTMQDLELLLKQGEQASANFAAPPHALFLTHISYPKEILSRSI